MVYIFIKLETYNIKNTTSSHIENNKKNTTSSHIEINKKNKTENKNVTIDSFGSSTIINASKLKCLNNTNFTICINITENNNETCVPECYLNCQIHFPDELEQKFCLLNVCKCEIFQETSKINSTFVNLTEIKSSNYFALEDKSSLIYYPKQKLSNLKFPF